MSIPNVTVESIARTGKSYSVIKEVPKYLNYSEGHAYLAPTHNEAQAALQKYREHGMFPVYLVGHERAREEYGIRCDGPVPNSFRPRTPEEAAERDDINAYQCLVQAAKEADIVVTVPELYSDIGDVDWLVMTEEAAFKRMLSSSIPIIDVKRNRANDTFVNVAIDTYLSKCETVMDQIDDLQRTDDVHEAIYEACRTVKWLSRIVDEWIEYGDFEGTKANWSELTDVVNDLLAARHKDCQVPLADVKKRLDNYNNMDDILLNVIFPHGTHDYTNDNRHQMHMVGRVDMVFEDMPDDTTLWLAGNDKEAMNNFHELVHGEEPEVYPFKGGFTPVQDSVVVIKMTEGRNKNIQSSLVQQIVEEVQMASPNTSQLVISGSSKHCAEHAKRIRMCTTPGENDDIDVINEYAKMGMCVAIPENSRFSEGVDTPHFDMGALYNGDFASPREDFMDATLGEGEYAITERMRAAQNAILRVSDVPSEDGQVGTGKTPVIVPSRHVNDQTFDMLEEYGVTVVEAKSAAEARQFIVRILDMNTVVHEGVIIHEDEAPDMADAFEVLRQKMNTGQSH